MADTTSSAEPIARVRPAPEATPKAPNPAKEPKPAKTAPPKKHRSLIPLAVAAIVVVLAVVGGGIYWQQQLRALPSGFAKANGRLEAEQVEIAAKYPGRIADVLVKEGDLVTAGQVLAHMDIATLQAERLEAKAKLERATIEISTSQSVLTQREAEREAAVAVVAQRAADLDGAQRHLTRSIALVPKGAVAEQVLDDDRARVDGARAAVATAKAQLAASEAAIGAAKSGVVDAKAAVEAATATLQRVQADIDDSTLVAPRLGRIQYKLAQPGEVLAAGGRVLTLLDLSEVYLTIFVPAATAGPLVLGDEARVTLDPVPGYVFPAKVTFVATEAQFTPKMVETAEEREKLMFRIKLTIDPELRERYQDQVKTGIRGIGYVRTDRHAAWPESLAVKLP